MHRADRRRRPRVGATLGIAGALLAGALLAAATPVALNPAEAIPLYTATPNSALTPGGSWATPPPAHAVGVPEVTVTGTATSWAAVCASDTTPTTGADCNWEGTYDSVDGIWVGSLEPTGASATMKVWPYDCNLGVDLGGGLHVWAGKNLFIGWVDQPKPADPASKPLLAVQPLTYDCGGSTGRGFTPLAPLRAVDSRIGTGFSGPVAAGATKSATIAGVGTVPADATAVVMNVTVTGGSAASYLTAFPAGAAPPTTANLLFAPGQTVPNLVTVGIGTGGQVSFFNQLGSVDVIADVLGFYGPSAGDGFFPIAPTRLLDSRGATGGWSGPLGAGETRGLPVRSVGAIPASADAVVMNVTVTGATNASYLSAFPSGTSLPPTANVLFAAGQTVPNLITVGIGTDGAVSFFNQLGTVNVIADAVGYYSADAGGSLFHPVGPVRLLDSRSPGVAPWDGTPLGPNGNRSFVAADGAHGIPADAKALFANVTVTGGTVGSYLAITPTPGAVPAGTANLLFAAGQTVPNAVVTGLGSGGDLDVYNQLGNVHVIIDAAGYFAAT